MNRLTRRAWFPPALGVVLYLTGVTNEAFGLVGSAWLSLSRQVQTVVTIAVLVVVGYLLARVARHRRSAYRASVRAAMANERVGNKG